MAKIKKKKQQAKRENPSDNLNIAKIILIALCVIFVYLCFETRFIQDDAYITFRYVENFVNGNGLVFNEGERVEGYTNFLWVIILSVFAFLKLDMISVSQYLSVVFGVVVLLVTYLISSQFPDQKESNSKKGKFIIEPDQMKLLNLLPILFLTFLGAFNYWSVSGMESTMFTALCLTGVLYYFRSARNGVFDVKISVLLLLAALTRPEGLYVFGIILIHFAGYLCLKNKEEGVKQIVKVFFSKSNVLSYIVFFIALGLYFLFRYSYYGYPFPNTYYAKTGFDAVYFQTGIDYVWGFFKSYLFFGIIFIAPFFLLKLKEYKFHMSLIILIYTLYTLYIISVGGDVLQLYRFFMPIAPLIFIGLGKVMLEIYKNLREKIFSTSPIAAFGTVLVISILLTYYNYQNEKDNIERVTNLENGLVEKMKLAGTWFNQQQELSGKKMTIAATTIGAVSYYAGFDVTVIDMLGLTDEEIAHNPVQIPEISEGYIGWKERNYNVDYVLSRQPDYIYFSTGIKPSAYAERALFTNSNFLKYYYPDYMTFPNIQFTDVVYKRKSEEEAAASFLELPENPNYQKSFINHFTGGLNLMRDNTTLEQAAEEFRKSVQFGPPQFGLPYIFLGEIKLKQGDKEGARERLITATELNDYLSLAHYYLYSIYAEEGDTVRANQRLNKIMQYSPGLIQR